MPKLKINIGTPDSPQWIELDAKHAETVTTIPTLNGDVTNNGNTVTLKNSGVTAGTYTKVTVNAKGLVTSGSNLSVNDIPSLPASKITQDSSNRFVSDAEKTTWNSYSSNIGSLSSLLTTNKTNVVSAINEVFQFASNGKNSIASAITGMGQDASGSETFSSLATKISNISSDATAAVGDVLTGKTFYQGGSKKTGTMPNRGSINQILTNNGQSWVITNGYHDGSGRVTANITNLTAANVKAGVSVGGVVGSFTSDANATAAQILSGYSGYVNGNKITGTMANRGALDTTITNQGGTYTIPAGYHNGSGKVTANISNLTAENIKAGVNVGGIVGTLQDVTKSIMVELDGPIIPLAAQPHPGGAKVGSGTRIPSCVRYSPSGGLMAIAYSEHYNNKLIEVYRRKGEGWEIASHVVTTGKTHRLAWVHENLIVFTEEVASNTIHIKAMSVSHDGILNYRSLGQGDTILLQELSSTPYISLFDIACSPDGRFIAYVCRDNGTHKVFAFRRINDSTYSQIVDYALNASAYTVAFSPDSLHLFVGVDSSSSNIYHFRSTTLTNLSYFNRYTAPANRSIYKIMFSPINNGYFAVWHDNKVQVGYFNGASSVHWYGEYAITMHEEGGLIEFANERDMAFYYDINQGGLITITHRGLSGNRNVILKVSKTSPMTITFVSNVMDGYGSSCDIDRIGSSVAFSAKSPQATHVFTFSGNVFGSESGVEALSINGEQFYKISIVDGTYPPTIEIAGNQYQLIRLN